MQAWGVLRTGRPDGTHDLYTVRSTPSLPTAFITFALFLLREHVCLSLSLSPSVRLSIGACKLGKGYAIGWPELYMQRKRAKSTELTERYRFKFRLLF